MITEVNFSIFFLCTHYTIDYQIPQLQKSSSQEFTGLPKLLMQVYQLSLSAWAVCDELLSGEYLQGNPTGPWTAGILFTMSLGGKHRTVVLVPPSNLT